MTGGNCTHCGDLLAASDDIMAKDENGRWYCSIGCLEEHNSRLDAEDIPEEEFVDVRKKPKVVQAKKMEEPFVVETMENERGEKLYGDAGDWLIRGVQGELYPCDAEVFEETYEVVSDERDEG